MKRLLGVVACVVTVVSAASAAELSGTVKFLKRRGQRPNVSETLVWLEPSFEAKPRDSGRFKVLTRSKTLIPHVIAVPVGSTIDFPNDDPISHNLFSLSSPNTFDLGFYRRGAGKSHRFERPGIVLVYCNVHPNMSAVIHVMKTPFFIFTDAMGGYRFDDLPAGHYRVYAWNEVGGLAESEANVSVSGGVTVDLTIDSRRYREQPHMNKEGKPYNRSSGNDY